MPLSYDQEKSRQVPARLSVAPISVDIPMLPEPFVRLPEDAEEMKKGFHSITSVCRMFRFLSKTKNVSRRRTTGVPNNENIVKYPERLYGFRLGLTASLDIQFIL